MTTTNETNLSLSSLTVRSIARFWVKGNLVSAEGLKHLDSKSRELITQLFTTILQKENAGQWVLQFGDEYHLTITRENAGSLEDLVTEAASVILSMPRSAEKMALSLAKEKEAVIAPLASEALAVASDSSSGVRNFLTIANRVNDVATKTLGGIGGAANVIVGAKIMFNASVQGSAAIATGDKGGTVEALLTGLMGLSLLLVGVGMLLFFPGITPGIGLPFLMKTAFALYVIIAFRSVYMLQYMAEFRKSLSSILESDLDDPKKIRAALTYLESFTTNDELKNKLTRRVGKEVAFEIQKLVSVLIADLDKGTLGTTEKAKALIKQVMESNLQLMSQQILLLLIAAISLPCYVPGVGATALFSEATSAALTFVANILWLFIDQRHCSQAWASMTKKIHHIWSSCFQDSQFQKDRIFSVAATDLTLPAQMPPRPRSITVVRRMTASKPTSVPVAPVASKMVSSFFRDYSPDCDDDVLGDDQDLPFEPAQLEPRNPASRTQSVVLISKRKKESAPRRATAS